MDEARFGLIPTVRRVWARVGKRPIALGQCRYQWSYLYGFVHPETGDTLSWQEPKVNTETFSRVLAKFASEVGAGVDKRIALMLDGAGWHRSTDLQVPEGIHLISMPPYSPELQPAERLWPLIREVTANRLFATLGELDAAVARRCVQLREQREYVRGYTRYHWWPADRAGVEPV
jgi:transposase